MTGMVWRELRGFFVAGALVPVIAYVNGASLETIGWLLALFLVTVGFVVFKTLNDNKTGIAQETPDPASEELGQEMNLLVRQVEDSAKVMLGQVRNELGQVRSLVSDAIVILQDSFTGLNQESKAQNKMVLDLLENLHQDAMHEKVGINDVIGGTLKDVSNTTQRIDHMVADAVRSLQFEDIVRQLTESSERHLDYLEGVLGAVDSGMQDLNRRQLTVAEYIAGLHELKLQIDQLEARCRGEAEKSVSQVSMSDGEVVLFE